MLDYKCLRQLYASLGLAEKDGNFPIKKLIDKSNMIGEYFANSPEENFDKQLALFSTSFPEFAKCQNSSMDIVRILLSNKNLDFNKCVVNRVYKKSDENKRPTMYIYADSDDFGEKFYYVDNEEKSFVNLSREEFEKQFECYEMDLKKTGGIRPWNYKDKQIEEKKDLSRSSGTLVADEGVER